MQLSVYQQSYNQPQPYNPQVQYNPIFAFDKLPHSWNIKVSDDGGYDKELSYNAKRIMTRLRHIVTNDRIIKYSYFISFLKRSQDQIRRYFDELEKAEICEIRFCRVLIKNGKPYRNVLSFNILKKGIALLGISMPSTEHSFAANMPRTYIDNNNTSSNEEDIKNIDKDKKEKSISKFYKNSNKKEGNTPMRLADIPDLTEEDAKVLNERAGTKWSLNYMQELHAKLSKTQPQNAYYNKEAFIKYFAIALANEKRSSDKVNHDSFRLKANLTEEEIKYQQKEMELEKLERSNPNVTTDNRSFETSKLGANIQNIISNTAPTKPPREEPRKISKPLNLTKAMVWANVRKELAFDADIDESVHKHWFSKLEAMEDDNKTFIVLKAPDSFTRDWIKNNYFNKIDRACRHHGYELWEIISLVRQTS